MTGRTLAVGAPTGTVGGMKIDGGISGAGAGGLAAIGEATFSSFSLAALLSVHCLASWDVAPQE